MNTSMVKAHATAATLGLLLITTFFFSTLISEMFSSHEGIATVKNAIFYAIWLLLPAMAITAITGTKLAGKAKKGLIAKKMKRMPFIAINGLLILLPSAVYLRTLALAGDFSTTFYTIQVIELIAGATNITLMVLNFRDGLSVSKQKRAHQTQLY